VIFCNITSKTSHSTVHVSNVDSAKWFVWKVRVELSFSFSFGDDASDHKAEGHRDAIAYSPTQ
jgi:hypothetical protein